MLKKREKHPKREAAPAYWNQFFARDIEDFCARQKPPIAPFSALALSRLWAVAVSDFPHHLRDVLKEQLHFDFFSIYCSRPDDALAVLRKMRSIQRNLNPVKKWLLCRDMRGSKDDAVAAILAAAKIRMKPGRLVMTEDVTEARQWIADRQSTRKILKTS